MLSFFPRDVLDEIWDLIQSASEASYSSKYNVGLKTPILQGLSEPEFYENLVYKFRKIIGKNDFRYHFKTYMFVLKRLIIT